MQTFGVEAVFGRPVLYEWEMEAMKTAGTVYDLFHAREQSGSWPEWAKANPDSANYLQTVMKLRETWHPAA